MKKDNEGRLTTKEIKDLAVLFDSHYDIFARMTHPMTDKELIDNLVTAKLKPLENKTTEALLEKFKSLSYEDQCKLLLSDDGSILRDLCKVAWIITNDLITKKY